MDTDCSRQEKISFGIKEKWAQQKAVRMILGKKDGALLSAYVEYFREVRLQVFKIVNKKLLNEAVVLVEVEAPFIAKKVLPGQFIIFRIDEQGERVPLTVADYDREKGTITLIVQMVGRTTKMLGAMEAGEYLLDVVGPLGIPTHL